jgi:hypothetical protein
MSHTFRRSEVIDLIDEYKAGRLTLDELADRFRVRRWPATKRPAPDGYLEMAARAQEDPDPYVPGSWDDVAAAHFQGVLSREEFRVLKAAMLEAAQAQDRDESWPK